MLDRISVLVALLLLSPLRAGVLQTDIQTVTTGDPTHTPISGYLRKAVAYTTSALTGRGLFAYCGVGNDGLKIFSKERDKLASGFTPDPIYSTFRYSLLLFTDSKRIFAGEFGTRWFAYDLQELSANNFTLSPIRQQECSTDIIATCATNEIHHIHAGFNMPGTNYIYLYRGFLNREYMSIKNLRVDTSGSLASSFTTTEIPPDMPADLLPVMAHKFEGDYIVVSYHALSEHLLTFRMYPTVVGSLLVEWKLTSIAEDAWASLVNNLAPYDYYVRTSGSRSVYSFDLMAGGGGPVVTQLHPPFVTKSDQIFHPDFLFNVGPFALLAFIRYQNNVRTYLQFIDKNRFTSPSNGFPYFPISHLATIYSSTGLELSQSIAYIGYLNLNGPWHFQAAKVALEPCTLLGESLLPYAPPTQSLFLSLADQCAQSCPSDCEISLISVSARQNAGLSTFSEALGSSLVGGVIIQLIDQSTTPSTQSTLLPSQFSPSFSGDTLTIQLNFPPPSKWTMLIYPMIPLVHPIRNSIFQKVYTKYPLTIPFPPPSSGPLPAVSSVLGSVGPTLSTISSMALLATHQPGMAFAFMRLQAAFSYLPFLSGHYLIYPGMVLKMLVNSPSWTDRIQDMVDDWTGEPICSGTPDPYVQNEASCSYLKNRGGDTLLLGVMAIVTCLVTILHVMYFKSRLDKHYPDWRGKIPVGAHTPAPEGGKIMALVDAAMKFAGETYGLTYTLASLDATCLEWMCMVWLHVFYGGINPTGQTIGFIVSIVLIIGYLILGWFYFKLSLRAGRLAKSSEDTPEDIEEDEKRRTSSRPSRRVALTSRITLQSTPWRHILYTLDPLLFTRAHTSIQYPVISILRSIILPLMIAVLSPFPTTQLLSVLAIDVLYLGYALAYRGKVDRLEYTLDLSTLVVCIVYTFLKTLTMVDITENSRQNRLGLAAGIVLLIYYLLAILIVVVLTIYTLYCLARLVVRKWKQRNDPTPPDEVSVLKGYYLLWRKGHEGSGMNDSTWSLQGEHSEKTAEKSEQKGLEKVSDRRYNDRLRKKSKDKYEDMEPRSPEMGSADRQLAKADSVMLSPSMYAEVLVRDKSLHLQPAQRKQSGHIGANHPMDSLIGKGIIRVEEISQIADHGTYESVRPESEEGASGIIGNPGYNLPSVSIYELPPTPSVHQSSPVKATEERVRGETGARSTAPVLAIEHVSVLAGGWMSVRPSQDIQESSGDNLPSDPSSGDSQDRLPQLSPSNMDLQDVMNRR
jgi:hypothetical protein